MWDEPKRLANLEKHGIDFASFEGGFGWGRFLAVPAKVSRTGRARFRLTGHLTGQGVVVAIVSPLGAQALSLVSRRLAGEQERQAYEQSRSEGAKPRRLYPGGLGRGFRQPAEELAALRPAAEVLPPALYATLTRKARGPQAAASKRLVSLRLDPDVLDFFRATGPGWQSRINAALREKMQAG